MEANGSGSTAAAVWRRLTSVEAEAEAEAGLVAADVLAVKQWWLEENRLVVVCLAHLDRQLATVC